VPPPPLYLQVQSGITRALPFSNLPGLLYRAQKAEDAAQNWRRVGEEAMRGEERLEMDEYTAPSVSRHALLILQLQLQLQVQAPHHDPNCCAVLCSALLVYLATSQVPAMPAQCNLANQSCHRDQVPLPPFAAIHLSLYAVQLSRVCAAICGDCEAFGPSLAA
jgi:hypothetical protein